MSRSVPDSIDAGQGIPKYSQRPLSSEFELDIPDHENLPPPFPAPAGVPIMTAGTSMREAYENKYALREPGNSIRERVLAESVVTADVRTNVIVRHSLSVLPVPISRKSYSGMHS
jgi:hypothetical protein